MNDGDVEITGLVQVGKELQRLKVTFPKHMRFDWFPSGSYYSTCNDSRKDKRMATVVVRGVYQVWVVQGDDILVNGKAVIATSGKNAEFKVLKGLSDVDIDKLDICSKLIFTLRQSG